MNKAEVEAHLKSNMDIPVENVLQFTVQEMLDEVQAGKNPPYGLIEFGKSGKQTVTEFDKRDPFGHLGRATADTLTAPILSLPRILEGIENAGSGIPPGNIMMGYLLAMVAKVYMRDTADKSPSADVLAGLASASYNPIVKKFSAHSIPSGVGIINHVLRPGYGASLFTRDGMDNHFPLNRNPFDDKWFELQETDGVLRVTSTEVGYLDGEPLDRVCPAGISRMTAGETALKAVWLHDISIAESAHYANPDALDWASR